MSRRGFGDQPTCTVYPRLNVLSVQAGVHCIAGNVVFKSVARGAGWLSRLSVPSLISVQVMISAPGSGRSLLSSSLSLCSSPCSHVHTHTLSKINKSFLKRCGHMLLVLPMHTCPFHMDVFMAITPCHVTWETFDLILRDEHNERGGVPALSSCGLTCVPQKICSDLDLQHL